LPSRETANAVIRWFVKAVSGFGSPPPGGSRQIF
jgi:hypothetical protein